MRSQTLASSFILNSFSIGNVTGVGANVGGLVGILTNENTTIFNSYWFNSSGNPSICVGSPKGTIDCTAEEDRDYFRGDVYPWGEPMNSWDFFDTWCEKDQGTPELSWQGSDCGNITLDFLLNPSIFRYANCSPDWEFYPTYPQGQTDSVGIINITSTGNINCSASTITYPRGQALATGWDLFACSSSSADPMNDGDCITYDINNWQSVFTTTGEDYIWLYGNCSFVHENPGVSLDFQGGK